MSGQEIRPGYKQTEVGFIPEEWEVDSLGDVLTLQRGFDLPRRLRRRGPVPIVTSSGIEEFHNRAAAKGPGIITGRYGTIGKVYFVETDYWPLNTTLWVRDFHGNDPRWGYRVLQTVNFLSHSGKSGVPGVNRNDVHGELVFVPPLPEQRAIAAALSDADAVIAALEGMIAKKHDLKQAAMQHLLTGKTRLPGFSGEWEVKRLGDLLSVRHGKSQKTVEAVGGQYPILATGGEIGRTDVFLYDKPSVLIGRKGTIDDPQYVDSPFWTIDTLFYTEITERALPKFIYYKFLTIDWRSFNEASGVPSLSSKTIEKIKIVSPDRAEQTAIAEVLSDMDADLAALEAQAAKARAVKQGMMQELLTGRVRLV